MAIQSEKPDLYTVLRRRRTDMQKYLSNMGVKTAEDLAEHLSAVGAVYSISSEFLADAKKCLESNTPPPRKPISFKSITDEEKVEASIKLPDVDGDEAESDDDLDEPAEKPTKRSKPTKKQSAKE